jgi:hypothetical protein
MKAPLLLTLIILISGSLWSWQENRQLMILREWHSQVLLEAESLGVPPDVSKPFTPGRSALRHKDDSHQKVKEFTDKRVALAKEMKEIEKSGQQRDEATQKRYLEMIDGVLSMNGEELKLHIADLKGRSDMDDEMKKNMLGFSSMILAMQYPETALALFTESPDLLKDNLIGWHVLSSALTERAKDSPMAALEWIKKNAGKYPNLVTEDAEDAKGAVIDGAALKDIGLAFQLLGEMKLNEDGGAGMLHHIAGAAETPEQQSAFLTALRNQVQNTADKQTAEHLMDAGLGSLFSEVSRSGYDRSVDWLKSANLSPKETAQFASFASGLNYDQTKADTGKWLDWLSTQPLDAGKSDRTTANLVRQWTESDYKAAGEWLTKTAPGPVKDAATMAYLSAVAPYDPDTAAQWADTLAGDKKKNALEQIYNALKGKDESAAADFAKRHRIEAN